jgi:hypothetical protein
MEKNAFRIRFGLFLVVLFSLGLVSCSPQLAQAQAQAKGSPEDIEALSEKYNVAISNCLDGEPCGYFLNQVTLNPRNHPWPVVGTYVSTRNFWYHAAHTEEGDQYTLDKVIIETRRSNRLEKEEFFFDQGGQLRSYSFRMGEEGEAAQDLRFFFDGNSLLAYREAVAEEEKAYQRWKKEDATTILNQGKAMQAQFAGMMAE